MKTFGKMPKAIDERDREESRKMILFFKAAGRSESSERQLRKIKKDVDKAKTACYYNKAVAENNSDEP